MNLGMQQFAMTKKNKTKYDKLIGWYTILKNGLICGL